jgi:hypothetical protein
MVVTSMIIGVFLVERVLPLLPTVVKRSAQQSLSLLVRRFLSLHDLLPLLHFRIVQEATIKQFCDSLDIDAFADEYNLLSAITPLTLIVLLVLQQTS